MEETEGVLSKTGPLVRNKGYKSIPEHLLAPMLALAGIVGAVEGIWNVLPILDIFRPGTCRVRFSRGLNRHVPVLLWWRRLLCL